MAQQLDVNVHRQAYKERKSGPIYLPESLQDPPKESPADKPWWSQYFEWERDLTVAGRTIEKGWVVPQPLGIALLVIILGGVGGLYWRIIDKQSDMDKTMSARLQEQRELLIRLDQSMSDKIRHDEERQRKQQNDDQLQDLKIQDLKDKLLVLNTKKGK